MENKTTEELSNEFARLTILMVNSMGNENKIPENEKGLFYLGLQDLQLKKNAIGEELKNRESKE